MPDHVGTAEQNPLVVSRLVFVVLRWRWSDLVARVVRRLGEHRRAVTLTY
jgi:hypothetical protein